MRTIQEILYAVIDAGYYDPYQQNFAPKATKCSELMCLSIDLAKADMVITPKEARKATTSIRRYLKAWAKYTNRPRLNTLEWATYKGKKLSPARRLILYSNWASRPYPPRDKKETTNA